MARFTKNNKILPTHTLRYWEKEFKQIKPVILKGNRRYYDQKQVDKISYIKFLLKDKGLTIKGVKNILKEKKNILKILTFYMILLYLIKKNLLYPMIMK